ncbi:hypothetical protein [Cellulomonas humilata]|uniref:Uncharacterized protein n=1 Tax=Cellulomonas humilata TaxID=144055 RepID=A0ABU0EHQ5_9CELL|nr:hypothetical protein [Cellulomonas humilata]MDQ0374739.1 hypothetical protein [Cellulomonas humilata]
MANEQLKASDDPYFAHETYRHLRTMLVALPALLLTGLVGAAFAFGLDSIQGSISAYYLGPMRDVFVGCMVGIAVCLVAYRGEALEDYALNLAGFYALFVAFVPTQLAHSLAKLGTEQERADVIASLRVTIAAVLLVSAAFLTVEVRTGHWAYRELRKNTVTRWFFRISTVLAVAFIVLLVWRTLEGETFDNVHVAAAVLLIASMATAVASYAWPARTGSMRPPTERSKKRRDSGRTGDGTGTYQWIFWLMVAGGIVIAVVAELVFASEYAVIIAELWELGLFVAFWLIQTLQKWEPPTAEEQQQATDGAAAGA